MKILDGYVVANNIKKEIKLELLKIKKKVTLALILVGEDEASKIYVRKKQECAKELGIEARVVHFSSDVSQEILLSKIDDFNNDLDVDAIMVQIPLPKHLNREIILNRILPGKDVDCLCSSNFGKFSEYPCDCEVIPVTALAVWEILSFYNVDCRGKEVVVVGSSNISGKPVALFLSEKGATVMLCNKNTINLAAHTKRADILVVAVGKKNLITENMLKEDVVVVDIGINRECGKLYGDVDFESVKGKVSAITPVPGGVGPVTVISLLRNVVEICKKKHS